MDPLASLELLLKSGGQSMTTPRRVVFSALLHQEPLSMAELLMRCKQVNRATVYRTIALFEDLGVVQRLQTGWKYSLELAGVFHDHHHHATCLLCGASTVVPEDESLEQQLRRLAAKVGIALERHQLELQGYCDSCQELLKD
ncbi:MAG TPA: Fur family transcriptional regulator [Candidatus Saccharimonadales bacterium]|nr:Fur family transcriptional regulator [Candidatus Saccharimonadales bacterium]